MSDARKQSMAILAQVAEFLASLPEDQLDDLESGAARLTIIPANSDTPLVPTPKKAPGRTKAVRLPSTAVVEAAEALASIDSREAAVAALQPFTPADLKEIASILGFAATGAKAKLISAIVERTVGNRLDSLAIRGTATLPY